MPVGRAHRHPLRLLAWMLLILGVGGCQGFTKSEADREVYRILEAKRRAVPELQGTLHVEAQDELASAMRRRDVFVLDTERAVGLAALTSRDFRRQRENVYLAALDFTLECHRLGPLLGGGGLAELEFDESGTLLDGGLDLTISRAFETGGSIALTIATDFLRNLTGDPVRMAQTILSSDVVVPLLRGGGRLVAMEPLRQAGRNATYSLRDFARFHQELTVDIATRVLRALALLDTVTNEEAAYASLTRLVDEQSDKAKAGKIPEFQLDQARQDLLQSDDRRQRARRRYADALDNLKLDLGVPMQVEIELDPGYLRRLGEQELVAAPYPLEEALASSRTQRLDLKNIRDAEQDAERAVRIAADALRASLDLVAGGSLDTPSEKPLELGRATPSGSLGLDLDLPLERTAERNAYVRAGIEAMRARRARERLEDLVSFEVRTAWRALEEAARSHGIQQESVRLAERRVESTDLLLQAGRADIRDRLDAETSRRNARNGLTSALVDHAVALLELQRDVGSLQVKAAPVAALANGFPPPVPADAGLAPADQEGLSGEGTDGSK